MKLHYVGEVIVSDFGICKVIDVDDNNICTAETIIPKEAFIEAFEKYIYNPTVITLNPLSNEETEKLIKTIKVKEAIIERKVGTEEKGGAEND